MNAVDGACGSRAGRGPTRVCWLSDGEPPEALLRGVQRAEVSFEVRPSRGHEPAARMWWVTRAPATRSDGPALAGYRVGVLHADPGAGDGLAQALREAGAEVALAGPTVPSLERLHYLSPDVLVVTLGDLSHVSLGTLQRVWDHPVLRWTPVLVCEETLFGVGGVHAPELQHLAYAVKKATRESRQLVERLATHGTCELPVSQLGPIRPLSAFERSGLGLRVTFDSPAVSVSVDVAEGIVAGAQVTFRNQRAARQLLGVEALAAAVEQTNGMVRACKVERPAHTNIMAPLDAALISALGELVKRPTSSPPRANTTLAPSPAAAARTPATARRGSMPPPAGAASRFASPGASRTQTLKPGAPPMVAAARSAGPKAASPRAAAPRAASPRAAAPSVQATGPGAQAPRKARFAPAGGTLIGHSASGLQASNPGLPQLTDSTLTLSATTSADQPANDVTRPDAGRPLALPLANTLLAFDVGEPAVSVRTAAPQRPEAVGVPSENERRLEASRDSSAQPAPFVSQVSPSPGQLVDTTPMSEEKLLEASFAAKPRQRTPLWRWAALVGLVAVAGAAALLFVMRTPEETMAKGQADLEPFEAPAKVAAAVGEVPTAAAAPTPQETAQPTAAEAEPAVEQPAPEDEAAVGDEEALDERVVDKAAVDEEGVEEDEGDEELGDEELNEDDLNEEDEVDGLVEAEPIPGTRKARAARAAELVKQAGERLQAEDYAAARTLYLGALRMQPDSPQLLGELTGVYLAQEDYASAARTAKRGVRLRPDDASLRLLLGDAYAGLGQTERAKTAWRRAGRRGAKREVRERLRALKAKTGRRR